MLMIVQGTTPKFSSIELQHWMEMASSSLAARHRSITTPSLAIFVSAAVGNAAAVAVELDGLPFGRRRRRRPASRRSIRPNTSERSRVSTLMPACSSSFSLKRTVVKLAGRAPMRPIRARRSPRTTRQVAAKSLRSAWKEGRSGSDVCCVVSEKGMPYWRKLLQTLILPQKLSRRWSIVICAGSSGKACTSTGTSRSANLIALATARSSPKLGSVTRMPSIWSRCCLKTSAHKRASASDSMAPWPVLWRRG